MIKRYEIDCEGGLEEDRDGHVVRYEDIEPLIQAAEWVARDHFDRLEVSVLAVCAIREALAKLKTNDADQA